MNRLVIIFYLIPTFLEGQTPLTLNEAVSIALKENYGIQIANLTATADAMQVYKSNAGFGPIVDWNVGLRLTGNNVNQRFIDGREVNRFGRAYNPSTDVSATMTLYDGGRMQAIYDRLSLVSELS
ncbi:MAG: TolC family protein, partial [Bacteroidota bacterium]